jgi:hypothetical protein
VRARLFLDLWFYFEERDSRRKIIETMEEYNEFFRFTPHAYLVAYVIYMAGVFDTKRGTISFRSLVREVKTAGQLKGQEAAVDALLVEAKPVVDKVLTLRHKAFAHRSAHISYDDVFKMAAVEPSQLRDPEQRDHALASMPHRRRPASAWLASSSSPCASCSTAPGGPWCPR